MNLTDEEALVVEKFRAKHARAIAYNEGVEKTLEWAYTFLLPHEPGDVLQDMMAQGKLLLRLEVKA